MARKKQSADGFMVCYDHQRRSCIKVADDDGLIKFIPLDISDGFKVCQTSSDSFYHRFSELPDYPIDRACQLYLNYCMAVGATDEVLDYLSQHTTVNKEDREMITSKRKGLIDEKPQVKKAPAKKKALAKKTVTKKTPAKSGSYSSAAKMFQDLIMSGKKTDDEIFKLVQEEFGLDDNKRSYVKWYRNNLIKKGENPPEAK